MSQSIINRTVPLTVPVPRTSETRSHPAPVWTRLRDYLATLRRDPRDPQVIDLRDRGHAGRHDVQTELIRAQARIYSGR